MDGSVRSGSSEATARTPSLRPCRGVRALLAVGAHEALDELLDVARLRQATLGQLVGKLGLCQLLVRLASLGLGFLGGGALGLTGETLLLLLCLLGQLGLLLRDLFGLLRLVGG